MGNSRIKLWLCDEQKIIAHYAVAHLYSADILTSSLPPEFYHHVDFIGVSSVLEDYVYRCGHVCLASHIRTFQHWAFNVRILSPVF